MRPIDADALDFSPLKDVFDRARAKIIVMGAHTIDAVPVVRCKDCKHYRNHPNGLCYALTEPYDNERGYKGDTHCVEPDDFCSYGERKDNG